MESRPKEYNCNPTAPEAQGTRQSGGRDCKRQRPYLPQHQNKTFKGKDGGGDDNNNPGWPGKARLQPISTEQGLPYPALSLFFKGASRASSCTYKQCSQDLRLGTRDLRDGEWISWWSGLLRQFSMEWIWLLHGKIEHTCNINLIVCFSPPRFPGRFRVEEFSF